MASTPLLSIMRDGQVIKTHPMSDEVVLGRAEGCAVRLDDRAISREHVVFRRVGSSIQVENKSEFAPLIVNGAECSHAVLKEGDVLTIGPYFVRFSEPLEANPSKASPQSIESDPALLEASGQPAEFAALPALENQGEPVAELDPNVAALDLHEESSANAPIESSIESNVEPSSESPSELSVEPQAEFALEGEPNSSIESPPEVPELEVSELEASALIDDSENTKIVPSTKVAVKLVFKPGTANVTQYDLVQDEVSIGRGKGCDIVLNDKKSSRKNSIIRRAGVRVTIKDLESANGTFVNGVRVQEKELSGEDIVKIGDVEFQVKAISSDYVAKEKDFMPISNEPEVEEKIESNLADAFPLENQMQADASNQSASQNAFESRSSGADAANLNSAEMSAIPGITGISGSSGKNKTLMERFRALPKRTQVIGGIAAILFLMWLNEDDELPIVPKKMQKKKPVTTASPVATGPASFESLPPEKKQYIEAQHAMAFDYYKNRDYDKALFEIQKIFVIIPEYKDAREIERYAKEGKRKMEALEDERRKKEEEAKLKSKIIELVEDIRIKMEKKEFEKAKEAFPEVLSLDPDNVAVANWKKEIENIEEQKRLVEQQKQVQEEINQRAWAIYKEALSLKKSGKYHSAIESFQKVIDVGASDKKLIPLSKKMIAACRARINFLRNPVLSEAKELENAGEFAKAFGLYKKATKIDPPHPAGYAGMNRVKGVLHDRAKAIYTEAILAESYSDFSTAKKMFQECLQIAPVDDVYYERAQRKLAHYFSGKKEEALPQ